MMPITESLEKTETGVLEALANFSSKRNLLCACGQVLFPHLCCRGPELLLFAYLCVYFGFCICRAVERYAAIAF